MLCWRNSFLTEKTPTINVARKRKAQHYFVSFGLFSSSSNLWMKTCCPRHLWFVISMINADDYAVWFYDNNNYNGFHGLRIIHMYRILQISHRLKCGERRNKRLSSLNFCIELNWFHMLFWVLFGKICPLIRFLI